MAKEGETMMPVDREWEEIVLQEEADQPYRQPRRKRKGGWLRRSLKRGFLFLLLVFLLMGGLFAKGYWAVTSGQAGLQPAVAEVFNGQSNGQVTNILILGTDTRVTGDQQDARTDSILILSLGGPFRQPRLVSLMRDTLVDLAGTGYVDSKLNAAFTLGEQDGHQGAEALRQVLQDHFDVPIQYYAMVDFETFTLAIDTLFPKGLTVDARFDTVEGQVVPSVDVPDDLGFASGGSLYQTITAGPQTMDGKTLLNYARFRGDDSADFGRTQRQQEVLGLLLRQLINPLTLLRGAEALGKAYALTSTNLSLPRLLGLGAQLLLAGTQGVDHQTIPAQGDWEEAYDQYGGLGLLIDFEAYQYRLEELGLR